jgi:hypothetical protein
MSAKPILLLSFSLLCAGTAAWLLPASGFPAARKLPAGKVYKSPDHIFTIVAPQFTGFARAGWEVGYESKKGEHEMATFAEYDFGETYRAGIVEAGPTADLDAIARHAAISRQHQIGLPVELVEETKVNTQFGEGSLRVYSIKGGSLVGSGHPGQKVPTFNDSYIAVLLVPHEGRTLFALSQDDNLGLIEKIPADRWKKSLTDQVQSFFATMTLGK